MRGPKPWRPFPETDQTWQKTLHESQSHDGLTLLSPAARTVPWVLALKGPVPGVEKAPEEREHEAFRVHRMDAPPLGGSMIRVLIADDHQLTLAAVKSALESSDDVKVVAEASSGRMALGLMERANPDVALIDMHMPGSKVDGLTCAERIRRRYPNTRVVIISGFTDESAVRMAFRRGAHAFISKAVEPKDIAPALRQAVSGTVFHAPPGDSALETDELPEGLSEREVTVLKAVAAGLANAAIAKRLWVSEHTVKFHLTNIFRKLDVTNRTEAARWAHSHGLVADVEMDDQPVSAAAVAEPTETVATLAPIAQPAVA
jgi:DNA-binding NarL/FixJ family response regulator